MQNKNTVCTSLMGSQLATTRKSSTGFLSGTNYRIASLTYFIYFCMNNSCWQSNERNVQNKLFLFHRTKETDHWQLEILWLKRRCMLSYFYALPKAPTMCYWHRSHPTYYRQSSLQRRGCYTSETWTVLNKTSDLQRCSLNGGFKNPLWYFWNFVLEDWCHIT